MKIEDRIKTTLGELLFQNIMLTDNVESLTIKVGEQAAEIEKLKPSKVVKIKDGKPVNEKPGAEFAGTAARRPDATS